MEGDELISIVFDASKAIALQKEAGSEVTLTLGAFSVFDGTLPGSMHKKIVRVKEDAQTPVPQTPGTPDPTFDPQVEKAISDTRDSLLYVHFIQNPPDGHADSAITVRMKAMEIVYHKGYVEAIVAFLRPPESQLESVGALLVSNLLPPSILANKVSSAHQSAASETLGELRKQSRAGLEYALQTHKTVDIKLDMKSPIIIIPEE